MTVQTITRHDLRNRLDDIVIVEALPPGHYADAHLPGARNLPLDRLNDLADQLITSTDTPVVVYCSNAACQNSTQAARRLVELGYTDVYDYQQGKQDWIDAGLPTHTGHDTLVDTA